MAYEDITKRIQILGSRQEALEALQQQLYTAIYGKPSRIPIPADTMAVETAISYILDLMLDDIREELEGLRFELTH